MATVFNKKKEYEKEVYPIIEQLYAKCAELELPMFTAVCVANNNTKTEYEYETLLAALQLDLKDNQIAKMLYSFNGFEVNLPDDVTKAIQTLQRYAQRLQDKEAIGVNLTEDQINDFVRIVNFAEVTIPKKMMGENLVLDDEFFQ